MKTMFTQISPAVLAALIFFWGCSQQKEIDPALRQAGAVIERILAPEMLSNSMFAVAYPECLPSQFAGYMVSGFGASELPALESNAGEEEIQTSRIMRIPLWPDSVSIAAERPDPREQKQIVLRSNDSLRVLIIEYYADPHSEPVGSTELVFPKVTASEAAKSSYGSYIDLGGR